MKKVLFLLMGPIVLSVAARAQDTPPVDTKSHYYESREICADLLDAGEAIIKNTRYCDQLNFTAVYDVFDRNCIVENNSTRNSYIRRPYIGDYLARLKSSKCSLDGRYLDFHFYYDKVDRSNFTITCLGDECSVDILVRQKFDAKGNSPTMDYCDICWKKFFFKLYWQGGRVRGKIIYITAGTPQSCN